MLDPIAWFCGNSGSVSHAVGTRSANAWGLHDVLGNVYEWCEDWWDWADYMGGAVTEPWGVASGSYRVIRGNSWSGTSNYARVPARYAVGPDDRYGGTGFRPIRTLP